MKINSISILKTSCIIYFLSVAFSINAQNKITKNYGAVSAIAELNRLAIGTGIEYERWLFTKDQFVIGGKAHYIFPSKTINYIFSSNEALQRNRQIQIMATSYFFTNPEKEIKGFFLSLAAGINFIKWDHEAYDGSGNSYINSVNEVAPGFDIAFGGQTKASRNPVRFTGGYQAFPARKYKEFVNGNGISLIYTKVSVGF